MNSRAPPKRRIPALFTALGNIVGQHWTEITKIAGGLGGLVAILDVVFGFQLVTYGTALVQLFTSDGTVTVLLLVVLISQLLLYQRVEWIVNQIESERGDTADKQVETNTNAETEEILTDGGSPNTPPRDDKGRFTTRDSGGSNVFLLILAAATGYFIGAETGAIDPVAAALISVALIAFVQSTDG